MSEDTRQRLTSKRLSVSNSPWRFKDHVLESLYRAKYVDSLYDRTRHAAQIFFVCTWPSKIYYFISLYFSDWKAEELLIAVTRMLTLTLFTAMFTLNFEVETRKRAGMPFIWISRSVMLPLYLYPLTGIPVFYTELLSAQVCLVVLFI
jgi:hypothetical protein